MSRVLVLLLVVLAACSSTPQLGDRCENGSDCPMDQYCARVAVCTKECAGGAPCPEGGACVTVDGRAVCLRACTDSKRCNEGEECDDQFGERVCVIAAPFEPRP